MQLEGRTLFAGMGKGWGTRGLLRDWSPLFLGQDAELMMIHVAAHLYFSVCIFYLN